MSITRLMTIGSGRCRSQMKKDVMIYVPILKTLEVLVKNKAIHDEVWTLYCVHNTHTCMYVWYCIFCRFLEVTQVQMASCVITAMEGCMLCIPFFQLRKDLLRIFYTKMMWRCVIHLARDKAQTWYALGIYARTHYVHQLTYTSADYSLIMGTPMQMWGIKIIIHVTVHRF